MPSSCSDGCDVPGFTHFNSLNVRLRLDPTDDPRAIYLPANNSQEDNPNASPVVVHDTALHSTG